VQTTLDTYGATTQQAPQQTPQQTTTPMKQSDVSNLQQMGAQVEKTQAQQSAIAPETPKNKTLRERAQNYLKEKQESNYEKRVAKAYFLNFYVQSPDGKWHLYKSVNKLDKKGINDIRKELIAQRVMFKEIEGEPEKGLSQLNTYTGRLSKNWKENLQETSKDIKKQTPAFSKGIAQAFETEKSGIPTMSVIAWGWQNQPKNIYQYPVVGSNRLVPTPKRKKRAFVSHNDYEYYKGQGYTDEELESLGVTDERSKFFQEQSRFGRSVAPYRPVSFGQTFFQMPPSPKTEMQIRIEKGEPWKGYLPEFLGAPETTPIIFKPPFVGTPSYNPTKYDNGIMEKKFFKPVKARL